MYNPSNPAPLYPAFGWVNGGFPQKPILPLSFLFAFNLCVLPRPPPAYEKSHRRENLSWTDHERHRPPIRAGASRQGENMKVDGIPLRVPKTHYWDSETAKGFCGQGKNFSDSWSAVTCRRCQGLYRLKAFGIPWRGSWPPRKKPKICRACHQDIRGTGGEVRWEEVEAVEDRAEFRNGHSR